MVVWKRVYRPALPRSLYSPLRLYYHYYIDQITMIPVYVQSVPDTFTHHHTIYSVRLLHIELSQMCHGLPNQWSLVCGDAIR